MAEYEIVRALGTGGMATVYEGLDVRLDRTVAIKELLPKYADNEAFRSLFLDEARKMAAVSHPYIVPIYGIDETHDSPWLIMEMADGGTLQALISSGPTPARRVLNILQPVVQGLSEIHRVGIVHRDIKPDNILSCKGNYKISDFGISMSGVDKTLPYISHKYVSPESLTNPQLVGPGSDIYSLGLVAYELLLGEERFNRVVRETVERQEEQDLRPEGAGDDGATPWVRWHLSPAELPAPADVEPSIPAALSDLIAAMVRKDPGDRLRSCDDLLQRMDALDPTAWDVEEEVRDDRTARFDPNQVLAAAEEKKGPNKLLIVAALVSLGLSAVFGALLLFAPKQQPFSLRTEPPGAEILQNGEVVGETPLENAKGRVGLELGLRLDGYQDTTVVIEKGVEEILVDLVALGRTVELTSVPSGALVRSGDEELGRTPVSEAFVAGGGSLVFERPGYATTTVPVPAQGETVSAELAAESPGARRVAALRALGPVEEIQLDLRAARAEAGPAWWRVPVDTNLEFVATPPRAGETMFFSVTQGGDVHQLHPNGRTPRSRAVAGNPRTFGAERDLTISTATPLGHDFFVVIVSDGAELLPSPLEGAIDEQGETRVYPESNGAAARWQEWLEGELRRAGAFDLGTVELEIVEELDS